MSAVPALQVIEEIQPEFLIKELIAEFHEAGVDDPREVAKAILEREGPGFLSSLSGAEQEAILKTYIQQKVKASRGHALGGKHIQVPADPDDSGHGVRGVRGAESVIRIAVAGKAYWSSVWTVDGTKKETRALTPADLEWLMGSYRRRAQENIARIQWLKLVLEFAREHKARTLGDLEKKRLDLPSLDVAEEA